MQAETLTPQQVRRVCTADSVSALASDPHTVEADPPLLAWSALLYLIIIGGCADLYSVPAWRWYLVSAEGVYALQHDAGGIIAAFVGIVSCAVK